VLTLIPMVHMRNGVEASVTLGTFVKRADDAVQETRRSVTTVAVVAVVALFVACAALIVAVVRD
jgi:hypothetical protein